MTLVFGWTEPIEAPVPIGCDIRYRTFDDRRSYDRNASKARELDVLWLQLPGERQVGCETHRYTSATGFADATRLQLDRECPLCLWCTSIADSNRDSCNGCDCEQVIRKAGFSFASPGGPQLAPLG